VHQQDAQQNCHRCCSCPLHLASLYCHLLLQQNHAAVGVLLLRLLLQLLHLLLPQQPAWWA
jgi:hypothetical protein